MSTSTLLFVVICIVAPLLLTQSLWIFKDAKKRGQKHYWLWGIFGLMNVPQSLIVYLVVTRIILDKWLRKKS